MKCEKTSSRVHSVIVVRKSILPHRDQRHQPWLNHFLTHSESYEKSKKKGFHLEKWNFSLSFLLIMINIYGHSCFLSPNNPEVNAIILGPFFCLHGDIKPHLTSYPILSSRNFKFVFSLSNKPESLTLCFCLVLRGLKIP